MRPGAHLLADQLARLCPGPIFHVPGEGILELLDALATQHPEIPLITARHEAGMTFMAASATAVTGRPHVCLAARAPGALNTCLALHTAATDAIPILLIIGQAPQSNYGREPFLDDAIAQVFTPIAKYVGTITAASRIPEMLSRALAIATTGRPGPVVLILPEDVAQQATAAETLPFPTISHPKPDLTQLATLLAKADRPLLLLGGTDWTETAKSQIQSFAEAHALPVATAYRRRNLFPASSPSFIGEVGIGLAPSLRERFDSADLILAIGARLGELNTIGGHFQGFTLLQAPRPTQTLIHTNPDAAELTRVYQPHLAIQSPSHQIAAALPTLNRTWQSWTQSARADRLAHTAPIPCPGPVNLPEIYAWLGQTLPPETTITVGAGAYALWPQRFLPRPQLGPKSGAMGTGLPFAIGAALTRPGPVLALAGDGCFMMHAEELATAVQHRLQIVTLVANNAAYGAISLTQQRQFGRATGTDLSPIDFAAFAKSFGAHGERVTTTAEFAPAFARALANTPAVIDLVIQAEATRP